MKTHCKRGHPFDAENTYFDKKGHKRCQTCEKARRRGTEWTPPGQRYPLEPLLNETNDTITALADKFGIGRRHLYKWQLEGIPETAADRCAIAINRHPAELWPEWLSDINVEDVA